MSEDDLNKYEIVLNKSRSISSITSQSQKQLEDIIETLIKEVRLLNLDLDIKVFKDSPELSLII